VSTPHDSNGTTESVIGRDTGRVNFSIDSTRQRGLGATILLSSAPRDYTYLKREGSSFYHSKQTFDGIPIAVAFVSAIEAVSIEGSFEPLSIVDEKHGGFDIVFLA
jgi:hypothetical protein